MKFLKYIYLLSFGIIFSCNNSIEDNVNGSFDIREAKGYYQLGDKKIKLYRGGVFRLNELESFKNLFPLSITDAISSRIALQTYQGLVKLNQRSLKVENLLAKSIDINEDRTVYTFTLNDNVYFHDDPCFEDNQGRKLTANDVKFCFDLMCSEFEGNKASKNFLDRVKGAKEHYESTQNGNEPSLGVSGIEVVDDLTLKITLIQPCSFFLKILTHVQCTVFPKEAYQKYGKEMRNKTVGTGPFIVKEIMEGSQLRLVRNEKYWEIDENGNKLPYLDVIQITFTANKIIELTNFKKSNLDMIHQLPVEHLNAVLVSLESAKNGGNPEFKYQSKPNGISSAFYCFNMEKPIFQDLRVRKAINMAIDRREIIKFYLKGEVSETVNGLVPSFVNYDNSNVNGFDFDPKKAQDFLADAGYQNGEGFPELNLEISVNNPKSPIVAEAIQSMLKENLGITINIDQKSLSELIERIENGNSDFWGSIWLADYPDPQNFLQLYESSTVPDNEINENGEIVLKPSYTNTSRYKNKDFDYFYSKGVYAKSDSLASLNYYKADSVLVADAAFVPIYYEHYIRLLQNNVHGFPQNPMEYRDFTRVFLSPKK